MKKFFQFAFVAVVALSIAACGNKSENKAEGSAAPEQSASVASQDAAGAVAENNYFKIANIPAGWENGNTDSEVTITINLKPGTDLGEFESVSATMFTDFQDPQQYVDEIVKNNGASVQAAEDVTFGGQTYKQVKWVDSADYSTSLVGKTPKGVIEIILSKKLALDNPDVKAILESVSFKE